MRSTVLVETDGAILYRGFKFAPESWEQFWPDAQQLLKLHYQEVGAVDSEDCWVPKVSSYEQLQATGCLVIVSARATDNQLVGYQLSVLVEHLHYFGLLCAFEDAFFLHPDFRLGWTGVWLIKSALHFLQKRGAQKAFFQSNQRKPTDKLFKVLGFAHTHTTYCKNLRD
jgi:GNAT superfamily N-acetyltransferase